MLYLPFLTFESYSPKTQNEMHNTIDTLLHGSSYLYSTEEVPSKPSAPKFKGKTNEQSFELREKVKTYRTIQLIINGHIQPTTGGTKVTLQFRPNLVNVLFMLFLFGILLYGCYYSVIAFKADGFSPALLTPFILFILSYIFLIVSTHLRMKQIKAFLIKKMDLNHGPQDLKLDINRPSSAS